MAGVGQQVELASAGRGAEGLHLRRSRRWNPRRRQWPAPARRWSRRWARNRAAWPVPPARRPGLRRQRHAGAQLGHNLRRRARGCADQRSAPCRRRAPQLLRRAPGRWWRRALPGWPPHPAAAWSRQRPARASAAEPAPQLQQHIAADRAAGKDGLGQLQMIQQRENVGGQLRHGQHRRIGNARKAAHRQLLPSSEPPCPRRSGTMARTPARSSVSGRQYRRSSGVGCRKTTGRPAPVSR